MKIAAVEQNKMNENKSKDNRDNRKVVFEQPISNDINESDSYHDISEVFFPITYTNFEICDQGCSESNPHLRSYGGSLSCKCCSSICIPVSFALDIILCPLRSIKYFMNK